jgi:hypothetical protein
MYPLTITRKTLFNLLVLPAVVIIVNSCDTLESDVAPKVPEVEIEGNEIYLIPNSTGYIDLRSMINSHGTVRLDITGQTRHGDLSEISNGLLQYSPDPGFNSGRDLFTFSVSRNNDVLKYDTVIIIVEPDTTKFPCGIYPQNDFVYGVKGSTLINVLDNDILCGDTSQFIVEVYRPDSLSFPPYFGTAVVEGNNIRYTPGSSFIEADKIMYRVRNTQGSTSGIGIVYIFSSPACSFTLFDDSFVFSTDSLPSDTVQLPVFANDELCSTPLSDYAFTMLHDGDVGTAIFQNPDFIYILPDTVTQTFTDSVVYQLCHRDRCRTATVSIKVNH